MFQTTNRMVFFSLKTEQFPVPNIWLVDDYCHIAILGIYGVLDWDLTTSKPNQSTNYELRRSRRPWSSGLGDINAVRLFKLRALHTT